MSIQFSTFKITSFQNTRLIGANSTKGDSEGTVRNGKDVLEGLGGHFMGLLCRQRCRQS